VENLIILSRWEVWAHQTSLTPPFVIEVPHVLVLFVPFSTIRLFDFAAVQCGIVCFSFYLFCIYILSYYPRLMFITEWLCIYILSYYPRLMFIIEWLCIYILSYYPRLMFIIEWHQMYCILSHHNIVFTNIIKWRKKWKKWIPHCRSSSKITEKGKIDTLARIYMISHFSGLVQELNRVAE
jgi:hypothetical protein